MIDAAELARLRRIADATNSSITHELIDALEKARGESKRAQQNAEDYDKERAPMITLEEHVARAIVQEIDPDYVGTWREHLPAARAAIAAVREREGAVDLRKGFHPLELQPAFSSGADDPFAGDPAPDPAEASPQRLSDEWLRNIVSGNPLPRNQQKEVASQLLALRAMNRKLRSAALIAQGHGVLRDAAPDPAEAMRATCEAIARDMAAFAGVNHAERIANRISALKSNGEGR